MSVRKPIITAGGKLQQLSLGDILQWNPQSATLTYSGDKLSTIVTAHGTKTFFYTGDQLTKIEDDANYESGRLEFFYTGDNLTSIVAGPWGLGLNPGSFDPEFWYDAAEGAYTDAGVTLATDGQSIQQWNDKSGNGHHLKQTTPGDQPSYQENIINTTLPVIRGDGTEWMVTDNPPLSDEMSFFVVLIPRATIGNTHKFGGQWPFNGWVLDGIAGQKANMFYFNQVSGQTGVIGNNVGHILGAFKNVGCWARLNGVATTESPAVANQTFTRKFALWSDQTGNDVRQYDVAEAIGYNKILTATQIDDVESFLGAKYGITI